MYQLSLHTGKFVLNRALYALCLHSQVIWMSDEGRSNGYLIFVLHNDYTDSLLPDVQSDVILACSPHLLSEETVNVMSNNLRQTTKTHSSTTHPKHQYRGRAVWLHNFTNTH